MFNDVRVHMILQKHLAETNAFKLKPTTTFFLTS